MINNETQFKLNAIREEIRLIREALSPQVKEKKGLKEEQLALHAKQNAIKAQIDELTKSLYKKRKWTKAQLEELLEERQTELRNSKLTATEERVFNAEIEKIETSLEIIDEIEEL